MWALLITLIMLPDQFWITDCDHHRSKREGRRIIRKGWAITFWSKGERII